MRINILTGWTLAEVLFATRRAAAWGPSTLAGSREQTNLYCRSLKHQLDGPLEPNLTPFTPVAEGVHEMNAAKLFVTLGEEIYVKIYCKICKMLAVKWKL